MFWAVGVVTCMSLEDFRISDGEGMIKSKLDHRRVGATVFMRYGTCKEWGRFAIWSNDQLPDMRVTTKEVVLLLEEVEEAGFW